MRNRLDDLLTIVLVAAALAVSVTSLNRRPMEASTPAPNAPQPVLVREWEDLRSVGRTIGNPAAPVQVVEFSDIECQSCRIFHDMMKDLRSEFGSQLGFVYVHMPLKQHRFAALAAKAAECAVREDRFEHMLDELFSGQDSLGLLPWTSYAARAGVGDMAGFQDCMVNPLAIDLVEKGRAAGTALRIPGTPTIIINGWRLGYLPTLDDLRDLIRDAASGRPLGDSSRIERGPFE